MDQNQMLNNMPAEESFEDAMLRPTEALDGGIVAPPAQAGDADANTAANERLAIRVGGLHLLCAPDAGREVILPPPVSRLPHTPEWLLGVANVRGALVPVVSLVTAFGLEGGDTRRGYLLISGTGENTIGLLVDGLPVLQHIDSAGRLRSIPPHPELLRGHVHGAYGQDGVTWLDMDARGFFETLAKQIAS